VNELRVNAPIETFGQGGRGFNVYTGTVILAEFGRVITHADGALGIQISQPIGRLKVRRGIETFGGTGQSLVKGVVMTLSVIGLSIKPGGSAREIEINGGIKTDVPGISPIEQHGAIETFRHTGGCIAGGGGFDKICTCFPLHTILGLGHAWTSPALHHSNRVYSPVSYAFTSVRLVLRC
jgi:hypothetical protein